MRKAPLLLVVLVVIVVCAALAGDGGLPGIRTGPPRLSHGPLVGAVTWESALVWARTNVAASVQLAYGTDEALSSPTHSEAVETGSASDFTAQIALTNLSPETTYYVDVLVNGRSQFSAPYPQFATFPPPDQEREFSVVVLTDFASAVKNLPRVQTFDRASDENPALVIIGGDFDHRNPSGKTAEQARSAKRRMFRDLYTPARNMHDFVNLILRRYPVAHIWDDHDYGQNNGDKTYPWKDVSRAVLQEYFPLYPVGPYGIWQSFRYAQAEFFLLDSRSQRDNNRDPDGPDKSMLDGDNLGENGQLQWLKEGLRQSQARWKFIVSPSVWNVTAQKPDAWSAFDYERTALLDFIRENGIAGVVVISGDLHAGGIDNGSNAGLPDMLVPSPNLNWNQCGTGISIGTWSEGTYMTDKGDCRGYGLIRVLTNPDRVELVVKDDRGNPKVTYTVR